MYSLINAYYIKFKALWEELGEYKPVHACTCGGVDPLIKHHQKQYVMWFLMGLSETYAHARGQILMMLPIPPMNQVLAKLTQEETQMQIGNTVSQTPTDANPVFVVQTEKPKPGKKDRPLCAHCGLLGHIKDKCYKLHGYPPVSFLSHRCHFECPQHIFCKQIRHMDHRFRGYCKYSSHT